MILWIADVVRGIALLFVHVVLVMVKWERLCYNDVRSCGVIYTESTQINHHQGEKRDE